MKIAIAIGVTFLALQLNAAERVFRVTDFNAASDGKTFCTPALQKAIDAAGDAGGGVVEFPSGTFLSGPLELRSGVTLQFDAGATLLGSRNLNDYYSPSLDAAKPKPVFHNLINGKNLHNVSIRGGGTIDGNGDAFLDPHEKIRRPHNIFLDRCENVLIEGVRLRAAGSWMQDYKLCTNVVIRGISVFNHVTHNNDGLDVDGSVNVTITGCEVDSDDDGICLKSTTSVPCRNVKISNCTVSSHCNALKLGTESAGGFIDISISNCTVISPTRSKAINGVQRGEAGIALETVDGGRMENVNVIGVKVSGVCMPILLRLGDRGRTYGQSHRPPVGILRNVILKDITAENCSPLGCAIAGLPNHPIENLALENIDLVFEGGGDHLKFVHKAFQKRDAAEASQDPTNTKRRIPEQAAAYPGFNNFGILPAYGFYCRHVKGVRFDHIKLRTAVPDARHALMFDDAENISITGLDVPGLPSSAAVLNFEQTRGATISDVVVDGSVDLLLQFAGDRTEKILLKSGALPGVKKISAAAPDVAPGAFVHEL